MAEAAPVTPLRGVAGRSRPATPLLPLVAEDLVYAPGGKRIIDGVSFRLESVSRTVVLGPNGAGKSVLLKLCHGLLEPDAGRIRWGQLAPAEANRYQGMVFQRPVMLRRSASANIGHVLKLKGVPAARRRALVAEALEQAGLSRLADRPARALSGGEQQRLSIARAWVLRPAVLLLDEPTSNLDPGAVRAVESLIRAVDTAGTKIIMTTHDIGQARRLADEIIFIHQGRVLSQARADAFFPRPADETAARFIAGDLLV